MGTLAQLREPVVPEITRRIEGQNRTPDYEKIKDGGRDALRIERIPSAHIDKALESLTNTIEKLHKLYPKKTPYQIARQIVSTAVWLINDVARSRYDAEAKAQLLPHVFEEMATILENYAKNKNYDELQKEYAKLTNRIKTKMQSP